MANGRRRALLALAASAALAPFARRASAALQDRRFVGTWSAFLDKDDPPSRLRLVIDADGQGRLTVIDVGDVPVEHLETGAGRLHLEIAKPPLVYDATLGGGQIKGTCRRGAEDIPLQFVRGDLYSEPPLIEFPPAPLSMRRLRELRVMARAPAMGVGWQFRGAPAHVLVDGLRSVAASAAVTPADRWHLGSITKSMTATLAARVIEAGALGWDARIGDLLGSRVAEMQPAYRDVTLLHVLAHRGGLPRDVPALRDTGRHTVPRLDYVRAALSLPPAAPSAEQTLYSNIDYVVAALMLETVTGRTWEALIADQVFGPLGIKSFGFGPPGTAGMIDQPQGHEPGPTGIRPTRADVLVAMAPAGRVHMNLADLLRYLAAHRDRPSTFLGEASWRKLHTPPFGGDYALGWSVSPGGVLSHGGTNQKWKAEVVVDREAGLVCGSVANVLNNNTQSALLQLLHSARLSG